jgi:hypothetical protein
VQVATVPTPDDPVPARRGTPSYCPAGIGFEDTRPVVLGLIPRDLVPAHRRFGRNDGCQPSACNRVRPLVVDQSIGPVDDTETAEQKSSTGQAARAATPLVGRVCGDDVDHHGRALRIAGAIRHDPEIKASLVRRRLARWCGLGRRTRVAEWDVGRRWRTSVTESHTGRRRAASHRAAAKDGAQRDHDALKHAASTPTSSVRFHRTGHLR